MSDLFGDQPHPPAPAPAPAPMVSNHTLLIRYFVAAWERKHGGVKYPFQKCEARAISFLLKHCGGLQEACRVVDLFLATEDKFLANNGYSIRILESRLPQLLRKSIAPRKSEALAFKTHDLLADGVQTQERAGAADAAARRRIEQLPADRITDLKRRALACFPEWMQERMIKRDWHESPTLLGAMDSILTKDKEQHE